MCTRALPGKHGLLPLIRPALGAVCHWLMVVSNCMPGSAHSQAALAIWRNRSRARTVRTGVPSIRPSRSQSASSRTACMNSSVTRTELLAFWYWMEKASDAVEVHVEPGVAQHPGLALLEGLAPDEVLDVGMVDVEDDHLGRPPGLAARLDRPGRRVGAAHEARPGPTPCRRPCRFSTEARMRDRLTPAPDPPLKMIAFLAVPVEDRVHGVVDGQDEARATPAAGRPSPRC